MRSREPLLATGSPPAVRAWSARPRVGVRPATVLRWTLALMLLGNLGRIPIIATEAKEAPLLVNEFALLATLGAGALACLQARSLRLDSVALAALTFAALGAGSAAIAGARYGLSGFELALSLAYLARWVAYFGLYVVVLNAVRDDDAPRLTETLTKVVLVFAAFGIVQSIFLPGFAQLVYPDDSRALTWDRQGHRLVSTLLDPNFAGALILIPLLVETARLSYGVRVPRWRLLLLLTALLMTVSRSSILALAVGGLVILAARGLNRRLLRFSGLTLLLALPFVPMLVRFAASFNKFEVDASAMARTVSWLRALTVLADNLLIGVGFNTYGFVQKAYGWEGGGESFALDGGLLFIAVMTGLLGVAVYSVMLGLVVRRCRRLWRDGTADPAARGIALGVGAATVALVVHSLFVNSLLLPFVMEPLWVMWGVVFLLVRAHGRRGAAALAPAPAGRA